MSKKVPKPRPGTLGALLADPNSNVSKIIAAHEARGGNFNPYTVKRASA